MRIFVPILAIPIWAAVASAQPMPESFLGRWQSNEALTLADMRKHPEVSEKARAVFEAKFFGRLVQVIRERDFATYWVDEKPAQLAFQTYVSVTINARDSVTVVVRDEFNEFNKRTLYLEGQCFYALVTKWRFREYFCRVP
jgi:hypothetical protein